MAILAHRVTGPPGATRPAPVGSALGGETMLTIRVHYPIGPDALVLRTASDWERDLLPAAGRPDGADFQVAFAGAFLYYKVLLRRDGMMRWSAGDNLLALPNGSPVRDIHPFFFADSVCSVCEPVEVAAADGSRVHTVRIFVPPGYHENTAARYPVVYMQDGQNLFFPGEAFAGHHWRIDETMRLLDRMNLVQPAIVVGVYPRDRRIDYTAPGYRAYGRYLVEDLKPWIDARYRTRPGPAHTAVLGSSLGGVVSLYLAWEHPDVFGAAGCLSSTFGWQDDLRARIASEPRRRIRIYLDSGWPQDNYEVTRSMRNLLVARGYRPGSELLYLAFPRATHDEDAWAMRAHLPVQHFFAH